jgi:hypothetical protein
MEWTKVIYYTELPQVVEKCPTRLQCNQRKNVSCIGKSNNLEEDYEVPPTGVVSRSTPSCSIFGKSEDSFKAIPFSALQKTTEKRGPLLRKEKGIFKHQWRRYWTGLYEHFLLMYASQRDVKPCVYVNIQGFVARPVPKNKDAAFEIVCPGKGDYQVVYTNTW